MMQVERTTSPSTLTVELNALREQLRETSLEVAPELQRVAQAAACEIEEHASLALLTQTIRVTVEPWPVSGLEFSLPIGPVLTGATATVTLDGASFTDVELLDGRRPSLRVTLNELTDTQRESRWVIEYDAGFGNELDDIPADLTHAILDQAATLYSHRGGFVGRQHQALSLHAARIAARYRRVGV